LLYGEVVVVVVKSEVVEGRAGSSGFALWACEVSDNDGSEGGVRNRGKDTIVDIRNGLLLEIDVKSRRNGNNGLRKLKFRSRGMPRSLSSL